MKIVVLTGAGISAESGIPTFRDENGLWAGHDVMEVASPQGWDADPELVLNFYNERRKNALTAKPNLGHQLLASLEQEHDVTVITQNIDNLHEQAGSTNVVHLHGELFKVRSTVDESLVYQLNDWKLSLGDLCEKGSQLRPHIVWFGEMVPMMDTAIDICETAEILVIVGTSLLVYPAASLIHYVKPGIPIFVIDPKIPDLPANSNITCIQEIGSKGLLQFKNILTQNF